MIHTHTHTPPPRRTMLKESRYLPWDNLLSQMLKLQGDNPKFAWIFLEFALTFQGILKYFHFHYLLDVLKIIMNG